MKSKYCFNNNGLKMLSAIILFSFILGSSQTLIVNAQDLPTETPTPTLTLTPTNTPTDTPEPVNSEPPADSPTDNPEPTETELSADTPTPEDKPEEEPFAQGSIEPTLIETITSTETPLENIAPTIKIIQPTTDITVTQGDTIIIQWEDEDPDDNAKVSLGLDIDNDLQNQIGVIWLFQGMMEDDDLNSFDEFVIDTSLLEPGEYYTFIEISDTINSQIDVANGKITILQEPLVSNNNNDPPFLNFKEPDDNITIFQGQQFIISWEDEDEDDNAVINFYLDSNDSPENISDSIPIAYNIDEDPDGLNDFLIVDTTIIPEGRYFLKAKITDNNSPPVFYKSDAIIQISGFSNPVELNQLDSNPGWKILVLIYGNTDFIYSDGSGTHHVLATMTDSEKTKAQNAAIKFVGTDIPLLTSGYMIPSLTIRYPTRALSSFSPYGGYWPEFADISPEIDLQYDSIIVIWDDSGIDINSGNSADLFSYGGAAKPNGLGQTYSAFPIDSIATNNQNVFKHEWGHSILWYFEATGTTPQPTVDNHINSTDNLYVHCPSGTTYSLIDENDNDPIPNSIYNNYSGFTHDYYSGTTAKQNNPTTCLGITSQAWAAGGPTTKPILVNLSATPTSVYVGESVDVSWSNFDSSGNDWISIHPANEPDSNYLSWKYAIGNSGTITFLAPFSTGYYNFRLFRNGVKVATSNSIEVLQEITPEPPHPVELYDDPNFDGNYTWVDNTGEYYINEDNEDQSSSLKLVSGWAVRGYRDLGQSGPSKCFMQSDENFSDDTFNDGSLLDDQISSISVFHKTTCDPLSDLVVQSITTNPQSPVIGQPVTFTVRVKNQGGTLVNTGFWVDLFIDSEPVNDCQGVGVNYGRVDSLGIGSTKDLVFVYPGFLNSGSHAIYAFADTNCEVHEDLELNNIIGPLAINVQIPGLYSIIPKPLLSAPADNVLITSDSIKLDWANVSMPSGVIFDHYQVQVASDSGFTYVITDQSVNERTISEILLSGLFNPNTKYFWRVRVFDSLNRYGNWSAVRTFRTAILPPALIEPLVGAEPLHLRPLFDWQEVVGASSYQIQISKYSNMSSPTSDKMVTGTEYTPGADLPTNRSMYWRVRAKGTNGPSAWSEVRTFTTPNPPSVPNLLLPANNGLTTDYTPRLDWSNSTLPTGTIFGHYQLQVARDAGFTDLVEDVDVAERTSSEYTFTADLANNTKYYWRVRAFNTDGETRVWSAVRSFRTAILPPELMEPLVGAEPLQLRPLFDWQEVVGATSYQIQISKYSNMSSPTSDKTVTGTEYTPGADLPANRSMYWRVRAKGTNGPSAWSEVRTFTTPNPPSVPNLLLPANNGLTTDYTPRLDWSNSTLPVGTIFGRYQLQVARDVGFTDMVIDEDVTERTNSEYTFTTELADNTKYYWRVKAFNGEGESKVWSAVRTFRTALLPPGQLIPDNMATLGSLRPFFDWQDIVGATSYQIQISKYSSMKYPLIDVSVAPSYYQATKNIPKNIQIFWRVRSKGINGPSSWSDIRKFNIIIE